MARVKPEDRLLSWHEVGRCWKKFYRGKMYYLDPRKINRSDDSAYRRALQNWRLKKQEIDSQLDASLHSQPDVEPKHDNQAAIDRALDDAFPLPSWFDPNLVAAMNVGRLMASLPPAASKVRAKLTTIQELVEAWILAKQAEVNAGMIGRQTCVGYEQNARFFGEWCGSDVVNVLTISQINESTLDAYKNFILLLMDAEKAEDAETPQIGIVVVEKRLAEVKRIVDWAWASGYLENLPRNIKTFAKLRNGIGKTDAHKRDDELFWTAEEAREQYSAASPRTRLYILLAANCGYTQVDIAALANSHVDWQTGIITRPRHKTDAIQVHKLWPLTLKLLKEHATKPDKSQPGNGLVLLSENGLPLISDSAVTTSRQDTVKLAFNLLRKKMVSDKLRAENPKLFKLAPRAGNNATPKELEHIAQAKAERQTRINEAIRTELQKESRSFKSYRKSSANFISAEYGANGQKLVSQFLGHQERLTLRYYVAEHHTQLFSALEFLRTVYDFESVAT